MAASETATPATPASAAPRQRQAAAPPSVPAQGSPSGVKALIEELFVSLPKSKQRAFLSAIGAAGATVDRLIQEAQVDAEKIL